ncbi:hypothetical protein AU210_003793 [Fusarium oxysporum f. sp. radicis-cucumerinum]|uniref:non-specific serine/threonine protein kinase n=1 Tax=Fusarium oxysporum f. sp. radicis-cucumerinum TaxID=327505 RepID=A0A2H3HFB1_FUSOX|nr:hypothetical protein AU210_003793 [Fusarium oxysporum f. sp. radicis-cucumerinum]
MYTLRPLNNIISEKYKQIGRPRKMKLWTEQWKDGELVMPMKPKEELIGDFIVLGDFGLAHKAGTSTQKMQSPPTYCAPERVHNINPSYGSDIWSYMCIFFELYTGTYLFQGWSHASVVSSIVLALGPLPESWKGTYHVGGSGEDKWYDQNWQMDPESDLKERITQLRPDVGARELELVLSILRYEGDLSTNTRTESQQRSFWTTTHSKDSCACMHSNIERSFRASIQYHI